MAQVVWTNAACWKTEVNNGGTSTISGEVYWVSRFVMEEEVIIVYPISNSVGICALNGDQVLMQAVKTTPPGVMYIEVMHDDCWE
jgi:hypothetical protein